jgi:thioredoxin reductase
VRIKGASALEGNRVFYGIESMPSGDGGNERIIVVGGGDVAFDYALNLSDRGHNVTILARSTPICLPLLKERAAEKGIEVRIDHLPEQVFEESGSVVLVCSFRGEERRILGDLIVIACGRVPNLGLLNSRLLKSVRIGRGPPDTGTSGLFLVGDVARKRYRQTGIAVGDGIIAAMSAEHYLARIRGKV